MNPIQYCSDKIYFRYQDCFDRVLGLDKLSNEKLDKALTISNYLRNCVDGCLMIVKIMFLCE